MTRLENQFLGVAATTMLWLPVKMTGSDSIDDVGRQFLHNRSLSLIYE